MNQLVPNKKIYAVIICYNAAPVLAKTYERIDKKIFDKIYFFDDNSPDGSAEIAKKFDLPILPVIEGGNIEEEAYEAKTGKVFNSDFLELISSLFALLKKAKLSSFLLSMSNAMPHIRNSYHPINEIHARK